MVKYNGKKKTIKNRGIKSIFLKQKCYSWFFCSLSHAKDTHSLSFWEGAMPVCILWVRSAAHSPAGRPLGPAERGTHMSGTVGSSLLTLRWVEPPSAKLGGSLESKCLIHFDYLLCVSPCSGHWIKEIKCLGYPQGLIVPWGCLCQHSLLAFLLFLPTSLSRGGRLLRLLWAFLKKR